MAIVDSSTTNNTVVMTKVTLGSLVAGILFWVIESYMEISYFNHQGDINTWLFPDDTHTLLHRFLVIFLFIAFGIINGLTMIKKKKLEVKLKEFSEYDALTKVYNRRMFLTFLDKEVYRSQRYKEAVGRKDPALIMFDIDHFKKVNDKHGQDIGDHVLTSIAVLVKDNIRNADILARIGGEEFVIIAPETNVDGAKVLAEKIRHIIAQHNFSLVDRVTVSIGISAFKNSDSVDDLIKRADQALFNAKRSGRNRVHVSE